VQPGYVHWKLPNCGLVVPPILIRSMAVVGEPDISRLIAGSREDCDLDPSTYKVDTGGMVGLCDCLIASAAIAAARLIPRDGDVLLVTRSITCSSSLDSQSSPARVPDQNPIHLGQAHRRIDHIDYRTLCFDQSRLLLGNIDHPRGQRKGVEMDSVGYLLSSVSKEGY
jgi:hypothetical protein